MCEVQRWKGNTNTLLIGLPKDQRTLERCTGHIITNRLVTLLDFQGLITPGINNNNNKNSSSSAKKETISPSRALEKLTFAILKVFTEVQPVNIQGRPLLRAAGCQEPPRADKLHCYVEILEV